MEEGRREESMTEWKALPGEISEGDILQEDPLTYCYLEPNAPWSYLRCPAHRREGDDKLKMHKSNVAVGWRCINSRYDFGREPYLCPARVERLVGDEMRWKDVSGEW